MVSIMTASGAAFGVSGSGWVSRMSSVKVKIVMFEGVAVVGMVGTVIQGMVMSVGWVNRRARAACRCYLEVMGKGRILGMQSNGELGGSCRLVAAWRCWRQPAITRC